MSTHNSFSLSVTKAYMYMHEIFIGFFAAHSTLRDCSASFLCSWSVHGGDDLAVCSVDPHPTEVKEKVIDFLGSEVRFVTCYVMGIFGVFVKPVVKVRLSTFSYSQYSLNTMHILKPHFTIQELQSIFILAKDTYSNTFSALSYIHFPFLYLQEFCVSKDGDLKLVCTCVVCYFPCNDWRILTFWCVFCLGYLLCTACLINIVSILQQDHKTEAEAIFHSFDRIFSVNWRSFELWEDDMVSNYTFNIFSTVLYCSLCTGIQQ